MTDFHSIVPSEEDDGLRDLEDDSAASGFDRVSHGGDNVVLDGKANARKPPIDTPAQSRENKVDGMISAVLYSRATNYAEDALGLLRDFEKC